MAGEERSAVFRDLNDFIDFINDIPKSVGFEFHNGPFDLKTLLEKLPKFVGEKLFEQYRNDSKVMAVAFTEKVSRNWLEEYEEKRKALNTALKKGVHRRARGYSLKTLAPFFLGVKPFWEKENHDDDEYVIADCRYTYLLCRFFDRALKADGTEEFYRKKLMPWQNTLIRMELRGIAIDMAKLDSKEAEMRAERDVKMSELKILWADGIAEYTSLERAKLIQEGRDKIDKAITKMRETKLWAGLKSSKKEEKFNKVVRKQLENLDKKLESFEGFNFNSDQQRLWLLSEYLGYDCRDDQGKLSTGKDVKEKLILQGKSDIMLLDEAERLNKLLTSFFPSYREMQIDGVLYCNFNLAGTKTGRLSSSNPNLQQVSRKLRGLFSPRPGYKFVVRDGSSIEPNMIAFLSEDKDLCSLLINDENFHSVATKAFLEHVVCDQSEVKKNHPKERDFAKQADLSIFYGTGVNGLIRTAKKHRYSWDYGEAKQKLNRYKAKFRGVFEFKKQLDQILIDQPVVNILGRKFIIEDPTDIHMTGFNRLVQSSASDLILDSGHRADTELNSKGLGRLLLAVHDELIFEVKEDAAKEADEIIQRSMTDYTLKTIHGNIQLKTDGGISDVWDH